MVAIMGAGKNHNCIRNAKLRKRVWDGRGPVLVTIDDEPLAIVEKADPSLGTPGIDRLGWRGMPPPPGLPKQAGVGDDDGTKSSVGGLH